jgi:acyl carrier protein
MTTENVSLITTLIASVLSLPNGSVDAGASMETIPQWDSLAQLNICLEFQERFGVVLDMETIANATSVSKLCALLPN